MTGAARKFTALERFSNAYEVVSNNCWEWKLFKDKDGYGFIRDNGIRYRAHRFAYINFVGSIKEGLVVCHSCDNPSCVNPDHLFLGTKMDNTRDMLKKGRGRATGYKYGEEHAKAVLTNKEAVEIRNSKESYSTLALKYGVGKTTISRVKNQITYNI